MNKTNVALTPQQFDFDLPEDAIAQRPVEPRDASRLMIVNRRRGTITHGIFRDLPEHLTAQDALVVNDTRVFPARLIGNRVEFSGKVECLLLRRHEFDVWEALVRPGRKLQPGVRVEFGEGRLQAEVLSKTKGGGRLLRFTWDGDFDSLLEQEGFVPLPPYIQSDDEAWADRYQTVYGRHAGSVAAPTAGLHFTPPLLNAVRSRNVDVTGVTLHVGLGTFRPVQTETIEEHVMHEEFYDISPEAVQTVNDVRRSGGRIVAVGTTVARVLESGADARGRLRPGQGWTDIFIYPGYTFRCMDALVTNFHLPRSTLLMLVCAFAGRELIMEAYQEAIREGYRFYSFGDAMFIV